MKRFLHWLVDFIDRKFPDKVVVTTEDYQKNAVAVAELQIKLAELNEKLSKLELNLLNVNQAMGMTIPKMGLLER